VRDDRNTGTSGPLDAAFERFATDASPGLLRSAFLLTGDRGHAEDLLQTALLRTLRRWNEITGPPAAYAFSVLVNLAHDRRRTIDRRPRTVPEAHGLSVADRERTDGLLERDAIVRAATRLSDAQREVLACRFFLDLTVAETAAVLGMPDNTVKSHCARALVRMRELLTGGDENDEISAEVRDAKR
jgi:RNA polymerase sigma factor (sigma-70 family)